MLIEEGHVVAEGDPEEIVRIHQDHSEAFRARRAAEAAALLGTTPDAAIGVGVTPLPAGLPVQGRIPER
jgi:hypothetical protein